VEKDWSWTKETGSESSATRTARSHWNFRMSNLAIIRGLAMTTKPGPRKKGPEEGVGELRCLTNTNAGDTFVFDII
jgi:hypothetical protein